MSLTHESRSSAFSQMTMIKQHAHIDLWRDFGLCQKNLSLSKENHKWLWPANKRLWPFKIMPDKNSGFQRNTRMHFNNFCHPHCETPRDSSSHHGISSWDARQNIGQKPGLQVQIVWWCQTKTLACQQGLWPFIRISKNGVPKLCMVIATMTLAYQEICELRLTCNNKSATSHQILFLCGLRKPLWLFKWTPLNCRPIGM